MQAQGTAFIVRESRLHDADTRGQLDLGQATFASQPGEPLADCFFFLPSLFCLNHDPLL